MRQIAWRAQQARRLQRYLSYFPTSGRHASTWGTARVDPWCRPLEWRRALATGNKLREKDFGDGRDPKNKKGPMGS